MAVVKPHEPSANCVAPSNPVAPSPWDRLRQATRARVGLGRTGDTQITRDVLQFQAAHARARDAVHDQLDVSAITEALSPERAYVVHSAAVDRETYLRRPDLGRQLSDDSRESLPRGEWDIAFVMADGLSARAVAAHGPALYHACRSRLPDWRVAPPVIALQGRVAIGDDIAVALNARMVAVFIGERPGLSVPDSMGVYFTYAPYRGCPDSRRNCLSNIHAHGLSIEDASSKLIWLMHEASRLGLSGVDLKERAPDGALLAASETALITDKQQEGTP